MRQLLITAFVSLFLISQVHAFCGFYVAKSDATLFNRTSQVIIARDGQHTVITMSNDYVGKLKDFAMIVPVPEVLDREDIRIVQDKLFTLMDNYSGPRLVEYYDERQCPLPYVEQPEEIYYNFSAAPDPKMASINKPESAKDIYLEYGVEIKATYKIDEYDILILSADQSDGLEKYLTDHDYKIPAGAEEVLRPYIRSNLKFFLVKVNLERAAPGSGKKLRPLQISFNSDRFMLPIRLGMANAEGDQDMLVYAFTRKGRTEVTNYRTIAMPTDRSLPTFIKTEKRFGPFYKAVFERNWARNKGNDVWLEYAWDVSPQQPVKCDPCVSQAPTLAQLKEAGVFWLEKEGYNGNVYITRMHVRYNRHSFPQDLFFQITPNTERYQARYVIRNHAPVPFDCEKGQDYLKKLVWRCEDELAELQKLTGWNVVASRRNYVNQYWRQIREDSPSPREKAGVPPNGTGFFDFFNQETDVSKISASHKPVEIPQKSVWAFLILPVVGGWTWRFWKKWSQQ